MNKRTVLASLNKIANELDNNGLHNEADKVTQVMSRLAQYKKDEYKIEDHSPYGNSDDDEMNDHEMDDHEYEEAYFKQNPDAPRTYEEAYFKQNPDAPRLMNPDAPRTMKPDAPRTMKPETREDSLKRTYLSEGRNYS